MRTLEWTGRGVRMIDQTCLPVEEVWLELTTVEQVAEAISAMRVRGAPAIGAAGAMGLALAAQLDFSHTSALLDALNRAVVLLAGTRPTAVNLSWALERTCRAARAAAEGPGASVDHVRAAVVSEAMTIADEDVETNRRLGAWGAELMPEEGGVLTHCNAGALATVGYGTALGVIRAAVESHKHLRVWVDETRPVLQGARLTAWELARLGIPATVIADGAAGALMARGDVDVVVVGADRVAANGDVANKIGTYSLAVLAARHAIPLYVAAPRSTIDLATPDGAAIVIEERDPDEIRRGLGGAAVVPDGVEVWNPAFDVTPAELVTAIVTEVGVVRPPFAESLRAAMESARR